MRYLKSFKFEKINEAWSEPYTLEFQDKGFDLEEKGLKLSGRYRGDIVTSDFNNWYSELISRLDTEYKVVSSKHQFNTVSKFASFEIEIVELESENYFTILKDDESIKLYPYGIAYARVDMRMGKIHGFRLNIKCKTESGAKKILGVHFTYNHWLDEKVWKYQQTDKSYVNIYLGEKRIGIDIPESEIDNLVKCVVDISNKVTMADYNVDSLKTIISGKINLKDVLTNKAEFDRQKLRHVVNL